MRYIDTQVYHPSTRRYLVCLEEPRFAGIYPRLSALVMWGSAAKTPTVKASHDRVQASTGSGIWLHIKIFEVFAQI